MVLVVAERRVAGQLTRNLSLIQTEALDALLTVKEGTSLSVLAWARQPPDAPGHKALARTVEQLTYLRSGDIWVEGSRQWRAAEDQLISPALFAAMR